MTGARVAWPDGKEYQPASPSRVTMVGRARWKSSLLSAQNASPVSVSARNRSALFQRPRRKSNPATSTTSGTSPCQLPTHDTARMNVVNPGVRHSAISCSAR